jgi:hypothetical protein
VAEHEAAPHDIEGSPRNRHVPNVAKDYLNSAKATVLRDTRGKHFGAYVEGY